MSVIYFADVPALARFATSTPWSSNAYPRIPEQLAAQLPEHAQPKRATHLILIDYYGTDDTHGPAHAFVQECGAHVTGSGSAFCADDLRLMEQRCPQGWHTYPGDVCRHGVYVGGMGRDLLCGRCENGD